MAARNHFLFSECVCLEEVDHGQYIFAHELLLCLNQKRKGKKGFISLKFNMSKTYDRMSWEFLELLMVKMGLDGNLVRLIMYYVKSVTVSVLVNEEPQGHTLPSRGIRQGNPLSSFLFLFCIEGLISLLKNA